MKLSNYLVSVSLVALADALTPYNKECGYPRNVGLNSSNSDIFVRCAETTYFCNGTLHGGTEWFSINGTNEPIPADCRKDMYTLGGFPDYSGPIALPGLTELSNVHISGTYNGSRVDNRFTLIPTKVTSIDLPDLENISLGDLLIDNGDSIPSLNVPKLRHIKQSLKLNFTGGPAINLTFPSLLDIGGLILLDGEIDAIDFPALNTTSYPIVVNSTGNIDCDAFAAKVVNLTNYNGVNCTSKKGTVTLNPERPPVPEPEVTSAAFKNHGDYLALTGLLAYIMAL
ncbi:hypothetical protein V494_08430 [Pseudogymnoascus sp. VKM F-4513 (FW-928)]|nr:hypothetical protein V494_08430 [Pseudogymnoascus sp. VKM F-4513 (FW-928)]